MAGIPCSGADSRRAKDGVSAAPAAADFYRPSQLFSGAFFLPQTPPAVAALVRHCQRCAADGAVSRWLPGAAEGDDRRRRGGVAAFRFVCEKYANQSGNPHHTEIPVCPLCDTFFWIYKLVAVEADGADADGADADGADAAGADTEADGGGAATGGTAEAGGALSGSAVAGAAYEGDAADAGAADAGGAAPTGDCAATGGCAAAGGGAIIAPLATNAANVGAVAACQAAADDAAATGAEIEAEAAGAAVASAAAGCAAGGGVDEILRAPAKVESEKARATDGAGAGCAAAAVAEDAMEGDYWAKAAEASAAGGKGGADAKAAAAVSGGGPPDSSEREADARRSSVSGSAAGTGGAGGGGAAGLAAGATGGAAGLAAGAEAGRPRSNLRSYKYILRCPSGHVLPLLDLFCQTSRGGQRCGANLRLQWVYGTMVKRCERQKNRDHDLWWLRYRNDWKQRRTMIRYKKDLFSKLTEGERAALLGLGFDYETNVRFEIGGKAGFCSGRDKLGKHAWGLGGPAGPTGDPLFEGVMPGSLPLLIANPPRTKEFEKRMARAGAVGLRWPAEPPPAQPVAAQPVAAQLPLPPTQPPPPAPVQAVKQPPAPIFRLPTPAQSLIPPKAAASPAASPHTLSIPNSPPRFAPKEALLLAPSTPRLTAMPRAPPSPVASLPPLRPLTPPPPPSRKRRARTQLLPRVALKFIRRTHYPSPGTAFSSASAFRRRRKAPTVPQSSPDLTRPKFTGISADAKEELPRIEKPTNDCTPFCHDVFGTRGGAAPAPGACATAALHAGKPSKMEPEPCGAENEEREGTAAAADLPLKPSASYEGNTVIELRPSLHGAFTSDVALISNTAMGGTNSMPVESPPSDLPNAANRASRISDPRVVWLGTPTAPFSGAQTAAAVVGAVCETLSPPLAALQRFSRQSTMARTFSVASREMPSRTAQICSILF